MSEKKIVAALLEDNSSNINQSVVLLMEDVLETTAADISALHSSVNEENIDVTSSGTVVQDFYEEKIPKFSDDEFQTHFRMHRSTMQKLIEYLKDQIPIHRLNQAIVQLDKKVYITVWLLATQDSYREVGNLFGLHKATISVIFHQICLLLSDALHDFIKWPTREEQEITKEFVLKTHKFPNCVEFVDGCHIQILQPRKNPTDFHNRKDVNSILLQAVCNEKLLLTHIYLGQTGRAHDARAFRESRLGEELQNLVSSADHILGDSAYTLSSQLLTPFRDNGQLTQSQKNYNKVHAGARAYIERTFGRLKGKFRRLKYLELHKTENITIIVSAACVLHNFILINEPIAGEIPNRNVHANIQLEDIDCVEKRNRICMFISTV